MKLSLNNFFRLLLATLLGMVHTASFAPLEWWWLQLLTLGGLYWLLGSLLLRSFGFAALAGLCFGLGWFLTGTSWIYISLHDYGALPLPLAATATLLFCTVLACMPALACALFAALSRPHHWFNPLLFAASWALGEWLRGTLFTGFPWIVSGSAHTLGWLQGYVPIAGAYGVSLLAALIAGLTVDAWRERTRRNALAARALALLAVLGGGIGASLIAFTTPHGKPVTVRLLQGNIPQDIKFDLQHFHDSFNFYGRGITQQAADLIAIPETALPQLWHQIDPAYLRGLQEFSNRSSAHLILGVPIADSETRYTNSAVQIAPHGTVAQPQIPRYDKSHLVPFGEFIPFGFRWFVDMMKIPLGDFTRGSKTQTPFAVADQRVAVNICYEDLFGEEIIRSLHGEHPATILLNLSNIAWFGDSVALPQHLQASQMRALESGRPMLRATNTGMTAVIDPHGKVTAALPPFTQGSLNATVQGYEGLTPYARWGNWPVLGLIATILASAFALRRRGT